MVIRVRPRFALALYCRSATPSVPKSRLNSTQSDRTMDDASGRRPVSTLAAVSSVKHATYNPKKTFASRYRAVYTTPPEQTFPPSVQTFRLSPVNSRNGKAISTPRYFVFLQKLHFRSRIFILEYQQCLLIFFLFA